MIKKRVKIVFLLLFCLILAVPFLFSYSKVNSKIELKGAVEINPKPALNTNSWFDGNFQTKYEKYINDNIGFRPVFVRIRNQVAFSLYKKLNAVYVIRGKENYLYEINYIKAFNGTDFIGADSINFRAKKIKELQDSLESRNKILIICLAAGKGSFYPEYFPDKYKLPATDSTNQKFYTKI